MTRTGPLLAAGIVAVLLGGCGGASEHTSSTRSSSTTTARPSSGARAVAVRGGHHSGGGYGKIPSWLPSAAPPRQRTQVSTFTHPVLTLQGESLSIVLPGARLQATAVGPAVPEIGGTPVPATSPVTFVVTFSHVTAPVALRQASFVLVDEDHHVHLPRMTAMNGGPAPMALRPGAPVSIKLHSVMPTGDGGLEWRPDRGRVVAGWDFNVEID